MTIMQQTDKIGNRIRVATSMQGHGAGGVINQFKIEHDRRFTEMACIWMLKYDVPGKRNQLFLVGCRPVFPRNG